MPIKEKRVAVIAIHGVGHHESGATAQAVTDLLAGLNTNETGSSHNRYTSFSLKQVQIALPPAQNPFQESDPSKFARQKAEAGMKVGSVFDERRGVFQEFYKLSGWFGRGSESETHLREREESARKIDIATEFMNIQLQEFEGDDKENSYTTWRHDGCRMASKEASKKEVHVYEMYWADLARPNNSLVRFLFSFYQLLLHLVSLGRLALDHASFENLGKLDWFLYLRSYTYATRVLSLAVLPLLVLIYGVALAPLPLHLTGDTTRAILGGGLVCVAGLFSLVFATLRWKPPLGSKSWWFWIVPFVLPGAALIWFLKRYATAAPVVLVVEWWIIGAAVSYWIFLKYDQVRSGAKETGAFFIGLVTLAFFVILYSRGACDAIALATTSVLLVQYVFLLLRILVFLFVLLTAFTFLMECICRVRLSLQKDKQEALARTRATARTARFAMAIPALLILLLAVFTGSAAYKFVNSRVDLYKDAAPEIIRVPRGFQWVVLSPQGTRALITCVQERQNCSPQERAGASPSSQEQQHTIHSAKRILEGIIVQSAPPGMIVTISLAAVGFVLLGLIILPSAYFEGSPARSATNGPARMLGNWLSGGFRNFRWTILLIWTAVFAVPLAFTVYAIWEYYKLPSPRETFLLFFYTLPLMAKGETQLLTAGGLIAGSAVVLAGILVKYLSAVLDTILDVDTYLRTTPVNATPRALIAERYVSLLRHIHSCREEDGSRSYDHIVVVAHSLGSLITADLLRYLHSGCMPGLTHFAFAGPESEGLPIYFFSMGCPLRQLLSRFFPHLYRWIREVPEDSGISWPATQPGAPIPAGTPPLPAQLRVKHWVNFYRSGDYVGRSIWTNDVFGRTAGADNVGAYPDPITADTFPDHASLVSAQRLDACIGLGAHTHYWDRTAPDVSNELDRLIAI
ncbi:MAG TPA: hypothetical protein VN025_02995 [Candidatus Dormibacteraeota bacterium]|nr:hypothetical protein [Candidatus Dormibacteraeota bacterium]